MLSGNRILRFSNCDSRQSDVKPALISLTVFPGFNVPNTKSRDKHPTIRQIQLRQKAVDGVGHPPTSAQKSTHISHSPYLPTFVSSHLLYVFEGRVFPIEPVLKPLPRRVLEPPLRQLRRTSCILGGEVGFRERVLFKLSGCNSLLPSRSSLEDGVFHSRGALFLSIFVFLLNFILIKN